MVAWRDERAISRLIHQHNCTAAYLDVGTNIGVQIRKLFEPRSYKNALAVKIFHDVFGAERRCQVCAIGIEPNPRHEARLDELEVKLGRAGAPVLVLRAAAATSDSELTLFVHANATLDVSAHTGSSDTSALTRLADENSTASKLTVRAVDLSRIFRHVVRVLPRLPGTPPRIIAKIDIEAAEFTVLPHLLSSGALCGLRHLLLEWHMPMSGKAHADSVRAAVNASLSGRAVWGRGLERSREQGRDAHCVLPQLSEVDDQQPDSVPWLASLNGKPSSFTLTLTLS